jgi:hypothetical protein
MVSFSGNQGDYDEIGELSEDEVDCKMGRHLIKLIYKRRRNPKYNTRNLNILSPTTGVRSSSQQIDSLSAELEPNTQMVWPNPLHQKGDQVKAEK